MGATGPYVPNSGAIHHFAGSSGGGEQAHFFDLTDDNEREQLEGFMMMYELVRPICRASLNEETIIERRKSKINLKTQTMTAKLNETEISSKEAL